MREVEIAIDHLVVEGVDIPDEAAFRESLVQSLTALASAHDGPIEGGAAVELRGSAVSGVDDLGADVARSVWRAIV